MVEEQRPSVGRHRRLADSDDSDDDASSAKSVLTTAKADEFRPKPFRLVARSRGFTSMEDMSRFDALDYVDLADNALRSLEGLASNFRLKTLIVRQNKLRDVTPLLKHDNLQVLDISDNQFCTTEWLPRARFAPNLIALVSRGNNLFTLEAISWLESIQSLVISNNRIEDISPVMQLTTLTKLSASKNEIRIIPGSISNLRSLRELRLAHNRISKLPDGDTLSHLSSLNILDVGHNRLTCLENLASCTSLTHVNVSGNPACADLSDIRECVQQLCPRIEVIDGKRIAGGRRKLRVNRQRLAAGLPLEPGRKFARPPSAYYIKKAQNAQNSEDFAVLADKPEASSRGDADRKQKAKNNLYANKGKRSWNTRKELPKGVEEVDDDDDALDAHNFLEMARSKNDNGVVVPETQKTESQGPQSAKKKSKRRKVYEQEGRSGVKVSFGGGGESQW